MQVDDVHCQSPWGSRDHSEYSKASLSWHFVLCGNFLTCFQKKEKIAFKNLHLRKSFNQQLLS
jgi:hypothetical protein